MSTTPPERNGWHIYQGDGRPHEGIDRLPPPPPWRPSADGSVAERRLGDLERAASYRADPTVVDRVNAALYLRRPLLVTGKPGVGKSTLAHSVAYELGLGPVLHWPINSSTTLRSGLYDYDAIGRVHESNLRSAGIAEFPDRAPTDIGRYIRLGPLGTALLPRSRARVLLIDELDKSDIDLPNDLLNVFEEGAFTVGELERLPEDLATIHVMTADEDGGRVPITGGRVRCTAFPFVVITSNGEREFPPAFLRRCVRLMIEPPSAERLGDIVAAHLGPAVRESSAEVIEAFLERRAHGDLATDQLLNAIYLAISGTRPPEATREQLLEAILRPLDRAGQE